MALDTPSLDDMTEFLVAMFAHLFPDADVSEGSPNWLWCKTQAAGAVANNANIAAAENDLLPDTCVGAQLDRWAALVGLTRKGATGGSAANGLQVFGNLGAVLAPNQNLVDPATGLQYLSTTGGTVGSGGYILVNVVAISTGSATNLNVGEELDFTATPAGFQEATTVAVALTGGVDTESDGDLRIRVLDRLANPPEGGAASDYQQWALAITGVQGAYVYPLREGIGTVDLAVLGPGSGSVRIPSGGLIATVLSTINNLRPVGVKGFRVLAPVASAGVNIEYQIIPTGDLATLKDWDDSTPPVVLAWNAGTNTLQFTGGTRPATMQAGQRIIIAQGATCAERIIQALSGADSIVLEYDPTADVPVATNTVRSGGPLVQPIRAAIQALFDSLGTANPDAQRYGTWEGDIRPGAISRVASQIAGVLDGNVIAPNATVEATDPFADPTDSTIGLLVAGQIFVHY